jgi:hypothetical protein
MLLNASKAEYLFKSQIWYYRFFISTSRMIPGM